MTTVIQRAFAGGELAPALYARVDQSRYQTGARTMRNVYVMSHGGGANRSGTTYIRHVKRPNEITRLVEFIFSDDQTYVLEFGATYIRIYKEGRVTTAATPLVITGATKANPCVLHIVAHGLVEGDEGFITGVVGMTQLNQSVHVDAAGLDAGAAQSESGMYAVAEVVDVDHIKIEPLRSNTMIDSSGFGAYVSGGTFARILDVVTPYGYADVFDLKFVQSADVLTIVHPSYAPRELNRLGDQNWTLTTPTFAPSIAAPAGLAVSGTGGTTDMWVVTTIKDETFEESLPPTAVGANALATSGAPRTLTWTHVSGAREYNVYKLSNGVYGFIGVAGESGSPSFVDNGIPADTTLSPPAARNPFVAPGNYPSAVGYVQQRLTFANTTNAPEKVWCSKSGQFKNFSISSPIQDDDAITFTLAGRRVNPVRHLVDLGQLVLFSSTGEWLIGGDNAGIIRPTDINPKQQGFRGANNLAPLVLGDDALFVQARGSVVRDLGYNFQIDKYVGNDLTTFSKHLIEGFTIVDWAYQQTPHSVVWAVRDDGILLSLTYVKEQQIIAWAKHDIGGEGFVESVCVIPEGTEDSVYLIVRRGSGVANASRIEKLNTRFIDDVVDNVFMDSALSLDGRNTDPTASMILSGGSTWANDESITLTCSQNTFQSTDTGNKYDLIGDDDEKLTVEILSYTTAKIAIVRPERTVPSSLRTTAVYVWTRKVKVIYGLEHLANEAVSVLGDGQVVASPNNASYEVLTVSAGGTLTLPEPYGVTHIGLPYLSDLETLDIDTANGQTLVDKAKLISAVTMHVEKSRGMFVGPKPPSDDDEDPLENLIEADRREQSDNYDLIALKSRAIEVSIPGEWNSNGRVFIRQVDPLPMTILSVAPAGLIPFMGGG